jgi:hypothetical protein
MLHVLDHCKDGDKLEDGMVDSFSIAHIMNSMAISGHEASLAVQHSESPQRDDIIQTDFRIREMSARGMRDIDSTQIHDERTEGRERLSDSGRIQNFSQAETTNNEVQASQNSTRIRPTTHKRKEDSDVLGNYPIHPAHSSTTASSGRQDCRLSGGDFLPLCQPNISSLEPIITAATLMTLDQNPDETHRDKTNTSFTNGMDDGESPSPDASLGTESTCSADYTD